MNTIEFMMAAMVYVTGAYIFYNMLKQLRDLSSFVLGLIIPLAPIVCLGKSWADYTLDYGLPLIGVGLLMYLIPLIARNIRWNRPAETESGNHPFENQ
jgi:hypothetical protein